MAYHMPYSKTIFGQKKIVGGLVAPFVVVAVVLYPFSLKFPNRRRENNIRMAGKGPIQANVEPIMEEGACVFVYPFLERGCLL